MNMRRIGAVTLWLLVGHIIGEGKCTDYLFMYTSEDKVYTIRGCNATLEWELGNTSFVDTLSKIEIVSVNGSRIARVEGDICQTEKDVTFYCKKWNRGEDQLISVLFINVTSVNSGRYMRRIEYALQEVSQVTKELIVIEKPQIVKTTQTILNDSLDITCTIDGIFKCVKNQWKLNGTDLHSTGRIYANSSILRLQRVLTVDESSILSCEVCEDNNCCIESESFVLEPYYGPDKLHLKHNERDIYLNENENFTVICFADCNPACTVWWEGYINSSSEVLVISSFESRMAGSYICVAKNAKTDKKAHSKTIFLHHAKACSIVASSREHTKGLRPEIVWMGPVIVSVFLLVIGCLIIVGHWRKNKCRKTAVQQNGEKRIEMLECSYVPRKQNSLQDLSDVTHHRNQIIESIALQTLSLPSHSMERKTGGLALGNRLDKPLTKIERIYKIANDNYNDGVESQAANNPSQEYMCSTINEGALWVYHHLGDSIIEDISYKSEESTEHRNYDYARSVEICHVATADVHLTDDAYITPICDLASPIQAYNFEKVDENASQETDVHATDGSYITPISDFAKPFEICQAEETDETHITPITA